VRIEEIRGFGEVVAGGSVNPARHLDDAVSTCPSSATSTTSARSGPAARIRWLEEHIQLGTEHHAGRRSVSGRACRSIAEHRSSEVRLPARGDLPSCAPGQARDVAISISESTRKETQPTKLGRERQAEGAAHHEAELLQVRHTCGTGRRR